jgi:16S rRNA processing protein RimM
MRPFGRHILVFVEELSDRTAAELWGGRYLLLPESEIEQPEEGEVFVHELPGMRVVAEDGRVYGEVIHTYELPQGLMLEVMQRSGTTAMLPFRAELVTAVSRETREITVSVPDGLFEI